MNLVICLLKRLLVASLIFRDCIEAALPEKDEDRNHILLTYDLNVDKCHTVFTDSDRETKEAGNKACAKAFGALDRLEVNSCKECSYPECRLLEGFKYSQCSCLLSSTTTLGTTSSHAIAFRYCAREFHAAWLSSRRARGVTPTSLRQQQKIYDDAVKKTPKERHGRRERQERPSSGASTSRAPKRRRVGGSSRGATSGQGEGTSRGAEIPGFPDTLGCPGPSSNPAAARSSTRRLHVCNVCDYEYTSMQDLQNHAMAHKAELRCCYCNRTFSQEGKMRSHMLNCRPNIAKVALASEVIPQVEPGKLHECDVCGKSYKWVKSLVSHKTVHENETRCVDCNQDFSTPANLKTHNKKFHPVIYRTQKEIENLVNMKKKPFKCEACGKRYAYKNTFNQHTKVHLGETTCDLCNKVLQSISLLNRHKRNDHP